MTLWTKRTMGRRHRYQKFRMAHERLPIGHLAFSVLSDWTGGFTRNTLAICLNPSQFPRTLCRGYLRHSGWKFHAQDDVHHSGGSLLASSQLSFIFEQSPQECAPCIMRGRA